MPQLDFVWWVINFCLIWAAVFAVLIPLLNDEESQNIQQSSSTDIKKDSTSWQWL